jgi:hypothetical protein
MLLKTARRGRPSVPRRTLGKGAKAQALEVRNASGISQGNLLMKTCFQS